MTHEPNDRISYFAETTFRDTGIPFGIRRRDRFAHVYAIGRTGTGKSSLLKTLVMNDIEAGEGVALFDPHGDLVEAVAAGIPPWRAADVTYLNVPDVNQVWHFSPVAGIPPERRALAAAGLVEVFRKLWSDDWGPRLEHLLRNVAFTLLENEGASLGDIPALLTDRDVRRRMTATLSNEEVRDFWRREYEAYSPAFRAVVAAPLQNKVAAFLTDPLLRRIVTGERSSFDLRELMDNRRILLVNLARGRIGEGPASFLGSLLVSSIALAAFGRADVPESKRRPFFVCLDEFHMFATVSLATMLAELRKYRVGLVLAHQYLGQLEPEIKDAVFGNAATFIAFRVGAADAPLIARELAPTFAPEDLIGLPNRSIYLRLLIDGEPSKPFSARTLPMP